MKTATHNFDTIYGTVTVRVDISTIDHSEAVDVYAQDDQRFAHGGWRIEGFVNDTPRGMHFYPRNFLGTAYFGEDTEDAARAFLAEAHQCGSIARKAGIEVPA